MRLNVCLKSLLPLLLLLPPGVPSLNAQSSAKLDIAPIATVKAKRGGVATVTLKASLPAGLHCNSNTPNEAYLIPLKLTWAEGALKDPAVVYPKPTLEKYSFSEKPVSVLTGNFSIVTKFKVPADAATGPVGLAGKLKFQACSDSKCFPPKTLDVNVTVNVE